MVDILEKVKIFDFVEKFVWKRSGFLLKSQNLDTWHSSSVYEQALFGRNVRIYRKMVSFWSEKVWSLVKIVWIQ